MQKMTGTYAYLDEAANLADENQFLIIGVVSTCSPKQIERILKRARQTILKKSKRQAPRMKFSRVARRVAYYVIRKLSQKDITVYAWIIDKEKRRVKDTPRNYGLVLSHVLKYGFQVAGWDKVWIDKKYSKERHQHQLENTLRKTLGEEVFDQTKKDNRSQEIRRSDVKSETGWAAIQQPDPAWTYANCLLQLSI